MPRLRLYDLRLNRRFNQAIGICQGDVQGIADAANSIQDRLINAKEAGETGWWGTWARVAFNITRNLPAFSLPRSLARVINASVIHEPVGIENEFYGLLEFGTSKLRKRSGCYLQLLDRGVYPTWTEMPANSFVRAYPLSGDDGGQRTLIQGLDQSGATVYSMDGYNQVDGTFLTLAQPFVDFPFVLSRVTGIQKDVTSAPVQYFAVDASTGVETPLAIMDPGEMVAGYRRYQVSGLNTVTATPDKPIQVEGIAKLEPLRVVVDTDYLVIQSMEAFIAEGKSMRLSDSDDSEARRVSLASHKEAIGLLQGQLKHYEGTEKPAVVFAPFGTARLERLKISMQ